MWEGLCAPAVALGMIMAIAAQRPVPR